jgi:hypothetical protein
MEKKSNSWTVEAGSMCLGTMRLLETQSQVAKEMKIVNAAIARVNALAEKGKTPEQIVMDVSGQNLIPGVSITLDMVLDFLQMFYTPVSAVA